MRSAHGTLPRNGLSISHNWLYDREMAGHSFDRTSPICEDLERLHLSNRNTTAHAGQHSAVGRQEGCK